MTGVDSMNMDLPGVTTVRTPRTRAEIALGPGDRVIGGGTWLYSEPQSGFDTVVDLMSLGWPEIEESADVLTLAATCRLSTVHALRERADEWAAAPLFGQTVEALLASFKIWNVATIGGNLCFGVPASAMVSLCTALDAVAVVWDVAADASAPAERRVPVADLILGPQQRAMTATEILRAVEFPRSALGQRTAFRTIALAELGRSGAVVIGRATPDGPVVSVTAATSRPHVLRAAAGDIRSIRDGLDAIDDWYDDDHGSPDWREAMTRRFVDEVLEELEQGDDVGGTGWGSGGTAGTIKTETESESATGGAS